MVDTWQRKWGMKPLRFLLWSLFILFLIFGIPVIEKKLHPNISVKIEKMLNQTTFSNCSLRIERDDEASIRILVVSKAAPPITTELYKYYVDELNRTDNHVEFFTHTINKRSDGAFYLTQTHIRADADLGRAQRIDVKYCDRLVGDARSVTYDGHMPIFECAVPLAEASCAAAVRSGN